MTFIAWYGSWKGDWPIVWVAGIRRHWYPSAMSRDDDIRRFLEGDSIQPPSWRCASRPFVGPLIEVLRRLPDEVFDDNVEHQITFIVDVDDYYAVNVSLDEMVPTSQQRSYTVKKQVIVLYQSCWALSSMSLTGLIAHEIAHSIIELPDHHANEKAADDLVREWGFEAELASLEEEKAKQK
jgi:hypothetical protein